MNYEHFTPVIGGVQKDIFLVNMTQELEHHFSHLMIKWIEKYLNQGKKIAIIVNKKWYSNGLLCTDCGQVPQCKRCSVSISYHKLPSGDMTWLCHICKTQYTYPTSCPKCKSKNIAPFGMWTEKVAEFLKQEFGTESVIVESATANSVNKIGRIFEQLKEKNGKFPIIIGTSLLTMPIKNYPFDLVVFLNADLGLNIPDYNASEKNFYLLYEAFLKHSTQNFIVQSFNPDHYSIRSACKLDKDGFFEQEYAFRKSFGYPPSKELCVILYKNEIEEKMFNKVDTLHKELLYLKEKYKIDDLEIYSTPPLIYKMFGKYRYNIILKWSQLKNFMDIVYSKLHLASKWFKIDRKAESIV